MVKDPSETGQTINTFILQCHSLFAGDRIYLCVFVITESDLSTVCDSGLVNTLYMGVQI